LRTGSIGLKRQRKVRQHLEIRNTTSIFAILFVIPQQNKQMRCGDFKHVEISHNQIHVL